MLLMCNSTVCWQRCAAALITINGIKQIWNRCVAIADNPHSNPWHWCSGAHDYPPLSYDEIPAVDAGDGPGLQVGAATNGECVPMAGGYPPAAPLNCWPSATLNCDGCDRLFCHRHVISIEWRRLCWACLLDADAHPRGCGDVDIKGYAGHGCLQGKRGSARQD